MAKPDCVAHWRDIQEPDTATYTNSSELLAIDSPFSRALGLTRIGIHHQVLPPGRRTSYPHAESDEEEFVYVLSGHPSLWLNGELHELSPGDGVGFPPGTGIAHTFMNNTGEAVALLVVGETPKPCNKVFYPCNPDLAHTRKDWWPDPPHHDMGPHDGRPVAPKQ
jgi:uncharacterized cupin superfamily protein